MLVINNIETYGWEAAIRGMRQPMNSHNLMDSNWVCSSGEDRFYLIGENDLKLMKRLAKAGTDHRKYLRMITVTMDITAPLYWWKEFDQYKVGTTTNSQSTMHKIHAKEFTLDDFSCEHLNLFHNEFMNDKDPDVYPIYMPTPLSLLHQGIIPLLNICRRRYIETKDKKYWWQMIQLLPSSYNQTRTVSTNYEALANMYFARKGHKLDEWSTFRYYLENDLPYWDIIEESKRRKREK